MSGDKYCMTIRRRPSVATFVAVLVTLAVGSQTGLAAGSSQSGRAPQAVDSVEVTATDGSSVTIGWPPSRNSDSVVGYGVYVNGAQVGTQTPDQARRWRDRQSLSYTIKGLSCGTGYTVGVDAVDRDNDHSTLTTTTVSTSACPDTTAPSAPSGMRQVAATETSVVLAWTASSDNVGVVEYGLYASGVRVSSVSDANATLTGLKCGTSYLIAIDAADAAGNRSAKANSFYRTSACPTTVANASQTGKVTQTIANGATLTNLNNWRAVYDANGDGKEDDPGSIQFLIDGTQVLSEINAPFGDTFANGTITTSNGQHTFQVRALNDTGTLLASNTITATITTTTPPPPPPPPPSSTGKVTQTIANGATLTNLNNWRAVYDANGDGKEDDPGSIQFLIDGTQVLSEINAPFGDTFANGTITTSNGQHTFQVRALNDTGTLLASNTITATITTTTPPPPPPPPPSSTGKVTQTIANGATLTNLNNWRAVYDANGDGKEDDPGSIQFLIDGTQVLSEINAPFGDTFANGTITTSNGQHTFQVRALNDTGTLLASNTITATITSQTPPQPPAGDTVAPSQPGNLRVASATATSVTLAWNASTDNVGVTGYDIFRGSTKVGTVTTTSYPVNGLTCGTAYTVGVRAVDAAGNTSPQATTSVTTSPCADTQPPAAPTNVTVSTRTTTSIALTWAAATDNVGVAGYGVYNGADLAQTTAGTTGIVSNLTCGTNYTLAVDAFDATGNSSTKTAIMVSTLACGDTTPPTQPTNLHTTTATTTSLTLAWNAATDNVAIASYDIYRAGTKVGTATTTSYTITGLTCGTTYNVGVRALDTTGNTSPQTTISASPSPCVGQPQACPLPAYPDASCTGVPAGTTLTPSGGLTISTAGTVIDGRDISGQVVVNAPNVTIRNTRIRTNAMFAIDNNSTGLVVEDTEIINVRVSGQNNCHVGIGSSNFTIRRSEITGCENAADIGGDNVTFADNYVHDLDTTGPSYVWGNGPHTDGLQMSPGADNIVVTHNSIDPVGSVTGGGGTSAIIMGVNGSQSNVTIEDNYLDGRDSSYALYLPRQQSQGIHVDRNRMQRGVYGYTACAKLGITVATFDQNTDFGTGSLISPDNGVGGGCTN